MSSGNSLAKYNKETPVFNAKANIDGTSIERTRNHKATATPSYGKFGSTTIWSSQAPQIDWAKHSTKDPLANFGSTGSGKGAATAASIFAAITGAVGLAGATATVIGTIQQNKAAKNNGFNKKETKEINKNTENAQDISTALDSSIKTAQNIDDSASQDTITDTNSNLMKAIKTAQQQKNDATNKANTAQANINTLNIDKRKEENVKNGLLTDKANITKNLKTLKDTDTTNMTDEQKSELKANIAKAEKDLKDIEKKIEESQKKIDDFDEKIKVQTEIKKQNEDTANTLDKKISDANKLVEQLNKKIKKD